MMKKFGFTLAEVLITLGIIGVVAALTAPALVKNTSGAQIGPTLAKVSSTLENAHQRMMTDEDTSDLAKIGDGSIDDYMETLAKYISGSSYKTTAMTNSDFEPAAEYYDGTAFSIASSNNVSLIGGATSYYRFNFSDNIVLLLASRGGLRLQEILAKGSFKGEYTTMYVDINGMQTKPNVVGRDIFVFLIDRSGKVIPVGSSTYDWLRAIRAVNIATGKAETYTWKNMSGSYACNETVVTKGTGCAGSIFENNLKVIYQ